MLAQQATLGGGSRHQGQEPYSNGKKRKRSQRVCTECRQNKLKCDAQDRFPEPCTRCNSANPKLFCHVDPNFKRSRRRVQPDSPSKNDSPHESSPMPPITVHGLLPPKQTEHLDELEPELTALKASFEIPEGVSAGGSWISQNQVYLLFDEFFETYHPHCPLLLARPAPFPLYETEPLLFWTICVIASRRPSQHPKRREVLSAVSYTALEWHVKQLVATLIIQPPRSVAPVQALLLLSEWPFAAQRTRDDLCRGMSTLALQIGLQLGLHRPYHSAEFSSRQRPIATENAGKERTLAWIYCYIQGEGQAEETGLPSLTKEDYVILSASTASLTAPPDWLQDIPVDILRALRVARYCDHVRKAFGENINSPSGQLLGGPATAALVQVFDSEFTDLEQGMGLTTDHVSMLLLKARICTSMYTLQVHSPPLPETVRARAAADCFASSIRAIDIAASLPDDMLTHWPRILYRIVFMSCVALIHLVTSIDIANTPLEKSAGLAHLSTGYSVMQKFVQGARDAPTRAMTIVAFFAREAAQNRSFASESLAQITTDVHSRMGWGNWLWRAIWIAKRRHKNHSGVAREGNPAEDALPSQGPASSTQTPVHDTFADIGLDFGPDPPFDSTGFYDFGSFSTMQFDEMLADFAQSIPEASFG